MCIYTRAGLRNKSIERYIDWGFVTLYASHHERVVWELVDVYIYILWSYCWDDIAKYIWKRKKKTLQWKKVMADVITSCCHHQFLIFNTNSFAYIGQNKENESYFFIFRILFAFFFATCAEVDAVFVRCVYARQRSVCRYVITLS